MSRSLTRSSEQSHAANKNLVISAGIISAATLCSRILGFLRDVIIANMFGAELAADAFFVAFRLPNLLRRLMGEGALSSSFIPIFTEYLHQKPERETWNMVSNVINVAVIILIAMVVLSVIFTPWIVMVFAPGYSQSPEKFELTTLLARILFPYIFFIGLAALSMGILNSVHHFLIPALTPAFLNLAMIFGALVIAPRLEKPIIGLAVGVLLGGVIQLFLQVPILIQKGMKYSFTLDLHHEGLRRIGELMLPSTLGLAVAEINSMIDTLLATFLPEGSVSYLYYSNRLIQFPLGLFGIAIGTAILPTLSGQAARGEIESLKETFSFGLRLVMFITIPATVGLIVFRHPIIKLLFERGAFTAKATQATALTLLCYAVGLFAYAGVKVVVPVFYSFQDTKTPVRIAIVSMIVNIALNIALMGPLQYGGLALASALSSMVNLLFLLYYVRQKMGRIGGRRILVSCSKICWASLLMGGFAWALMKQSMLMAPNRALSHGALLIIILLSVVIYACVSFFLKSPEMAFLIGALRKKYQ